jgi:septal ring factor EnvC (AmiA/AmiB activator)
MNEAAGKVTGQYIWRTVGDNKVRDSHAVLEGTIRNHNDSPTPAEEFNCRCWAENVLVRTPKNDCDELRKKLKEAQKRVKDLSNKLNNLLLHLDKLIKKNDELVKNAQKSLGTRIVAHMLTLPFNRLGILGDLLQQYFEGIISTELIKSAENFMQELWVIKQEIENTKDQISIVFAELEKAAKDIEKEKERLKECEEKQNQPKQHE